MALRIFDINPVTRKRLRRFRKRKRAYVSFWLLILILSLSLCADLLCNDKPLYVRYDGQSYYPFLRFYPESVFLSNGKATRPDYKALDQSPAFAQSETNVMIFAPIPFGPEETIEIESIRTDGAITATFTPVSKVGSVNVDRELIIVRSQAAGSFLGRGSGTSNGDRLETHWPVSTTLRKAVENRFDNQDSPPFHEAAKSLANPSLGAELCLSTFRPRSRPPSTVRITFRETTQTSLRPVSISFDKDGNPRSTDPLWDQFPESDRQNIRRGVETCHGGTAPELTAHAGNTTYRIRLINSVTFPHHPVTGHWFGIDSTGRDVLSLVVHGLRVSLLFSFLLVAGSMSVGVLVGAVQGYYGGAVDLVGQRVIEIWSAVPFLYVMILMGSIYGRSFALLLLCYGLFRWIGISYYMRAEFLRLRKRPFVDAARSMGIPSRKIIVRHILPNALTPVVTFLPFSLVGAIGALAALDYLGFGLPALTPSLGQLLQQAQQFRWAWWLIVFPSLTLLIVILLGVFVGEGIRDAYDPTPKSQIN